MKTLTTLILFCAIYINLSGQNVYIKLPKADKKIENPALRRDSMFTGEVELNLYESNTLEFKDSLLIKSILKYSKGTLEEARDYYPDGSLYTIRQYNKFGRNGEYISYYPNGRMSYFGIFRNDSLQIPKLEWYPSGLSKCIIDFNTDFIMEWFPNGNIKYSCRRNLSGKGVNLKYFYLSGKLESERFEECGLQPYKEYFENGNVKMSGYVIDYIYIQVGKWQEFYESGKLKREYSFKDHSPNIKEGLWKWYDENGNVTKTEMYSNDQLISK